MLGAKTSPENPSANLFPNISAFIEEGSGGPKKGNIYCNLILVATLFILRSFEQHGLHISTLFAALQTSPSLAESISRVGGVDFPYLESIPWFGGVDCFTTGGGRNR